MGLRWRLTVLHKRNLMNFRMAAKEKAGADMTNKMLLADDEGDREAGPFGYVRGERIIFKKPHLTGGGEMIKFILRFSMKGMGLCGSMNRTSRAL